MQTLDYPNSPYAAPVVSHPIKYSKIETSKFKRAPTLGEPTDKILSEIGFDQKTIQSM
jgi:crotonobetainyl-CoA:carnitine CoA-transferase CaiB-like acyl-CoA transferase